MAFINTGNPNTGIDTKILLIDSNGQQYSFSTLSHDLLTFESKPKTGQIVTKSISDNGREHVQTERYGWTGSFTVTRKGADFENLEYAQELLFRSNGDPLTFTIHQQTRNRDGSGTVTKWRYERCDLRLTEAGSYSLGTEVVLSLSFDATDRYPE